MRRTTRFIAAAAIVAAAGAVAPALGAPGALAGAGSASTLSCATGPIAIEGTNPSGHQWVFHVSAGNGSTVGCADAGTTVITGTWNPASGGCVPSVTGTVCLSAVAAVATPVTVGLSVCFPLGGPCYTGSALVTRV